MIIKFIGYDSEIDFNNSNAYTLEVHNKDLFLKVCYDLYNLCYSNHEINNYILLINDEIEKFSKHTIFVDSIFDFDINSKKYINRLYNHVEKMFNLNIEIKREFELNIANINSVVQDLLNDLDIEVTLNDEIKISNYLKLINLCFNSDSNDVLTSIYRFIDIVSELNICKLFIFINLRNLFDNKTLEELFKYAIYKDVFILNIENGSCVKIKYEKKMIIDHDLIDYLY